MLAPEVPDSDLVTGLIRDFAQVEDWSVFWHPVDTTDLGYDYAMAVRDATGWTPRLPDTEAPDGTRFMEFKLPSQAAVSAHETGVRQIFPTLWRLRLPREGLTERSHIQARAAAEQALYDNVRLFREYLGDPFVGPIGVRPRQEPAPLHMLYDGIAACWRRGDAIIQLDVYEQADYPTEPVYMSMELIVTPDRTHQS